MFYLDPTHDMVFKRIFGKENLKDILINFLNSILRLEGEIVESPSRFSVQIGPGQHVEVPAEVQVKQPLDRYRWRWRNHSCEPNAKFENPNLVAIREIKASEQIAFDYNTTEYDLATPFECHCKSDGCCGLVRGNRWQQDQAAAEG